MIYNLYAILDTKVNAYNTPMAFRTRGEAIRAFTDEVNRDGSTFKKYPDDFALFELGSYDDASAGFLLLDAPLNIGLARHFMHMADVVQFKPKQIDLEEAIASSASTK